MVNDPGWERVLIIKDARKKTSWLHKVKMSLCNDKLPVEVTKVIDLLWVEYPEARSTQY